MMVAWTAILLLSAPQQTPGAAEKKEAKWLSKYAEALQLAQKEGKPLVIDGSRAG